MDAIREVLTPEQWEQFQHPVAIELKQGECSFHHPLMVHGSFANGTSRPRRAVVLNVIRDGVRRRATNRCWAACRRCPQGNHSADNSFRYCWIRRRSPRARRSSRNYELLAPGRARLLPSRTPGPGAHGSAGASPSRGGTYDE